MSEFGINTNPRSPVFLFLVPSSPVPRSPVLTRLAPFAASRFRVGTQVEIELEVRPRKLGGVLLYVHGRKDFLLLQMAEDGKLL